MGGGAARELFLYNAIAIDVACQGMSDFVILMYFNGIFITCLFDVNYSRFIAFVTPDMINGVNCLCFMYSPSVCCITGILY